MAKNEVLLLMLRKIMRQREKNKQIFCPIDWTFTDGMSHSFGLFQYQISNISNVSKILNIHCSSLCRANTLVLLTPYSGRKLCPLKACWTPACEQTTHTTLLKRRKNWKLDAGSHQLPDTPCGLWVSGEGGQPQRPTCWGVFCWGGRVRATHRAAGPRKAPDRVVDDCVPGLLHQGVPQLSQQNCGGLCNNPNNHKQKGQKIPNPYRALLKKCTYIICTHIQFNDTYAGVFSAFFFTYICMCVSV